MEENNKKFLASDLIILIVISAIVLFFGRDYLLLKERVGKLEKNIESHELFETQKVDTIINKNKSN